MTKKERRKALKEQFLKAELFKLRHAALVKSGLTPMQAFNQAHKEMHTLKLTGFQA